MATKLYVGNLSYDTTEDQVRTLFAQAGEISEIAFIMDRDTGRPKGFGFVTMATEEGSKEAIKRFNGFTMDNRALTVNEAKPREERSTGGGFGGANRNSSGPRGGSGGNGGRGRF
ncbi:MAG: RNA-binding protein [Chloroflexota bacterium]|nr:RNA-binding protein [Anaerolineae bacterium]